MADKTPIASKPGDMHMQDSEALRDERRGMNQHANRKQRRQMAKNSRLFKYGLWPKLTVPPEMNVQTINKETSNGKVKEN